MGNKNITNKTDMSVMIEVLEQFESCEHSKASLGRFYNVSPRTIGRWIKKADDYLKSEVGEVGDYLKSEVTEDSNEQTSESRQRPEVRNYQLSKGFITIILSNGETKSADSSHEYFDEITTRLLTNEQEEMDYVIELMDQKAKLLNMGIAGLDVVNSQIFYNGELISGAVASILIKRLEIGDNPEHLAAFIKRAMKNNSLVSMDTVFDFLAYNDIMINRSGMILGWKYVNNNFKDDYTGKIDNSVGSLVEMEREDVDADPTKACSSGLHVGSIDYVKRHSKIVLVSLDPADVVVVPTDYSGQKLRACRYTVIADVSDVVRKYNAGEIELSELLQQANIKAESLKGEVCD